MKSWTQSVAESYGLLEFFSVLQAEIHSIVETYKWLEHNQNTKHSIVIMMDSQTVIRALDSMIFEVVGKCTDVVNSLSDMFQVIGFLVSEDIACVLLAEGNTVGASRNTAKNSNSVCQYCERAG